MTPPYKAIPNRTLNWNLKVYRYNELGEPDCVPSLATQLEILFKYYSHIEFQAALCYTTIDMLN